MTRNEFLCVLNEYEIPYSVSDVEGYDGVYVFSKKEYDMKRAHPRKHKNLYVPYIRVSHFDEGETWYTRQDGWTSYMTVEEVIDIVKKMGA